MTRPQTKYLHSILADAVDRWLEPPAEVEMTDCLQCEATGQTPNPDKPGEFIECEPCSGTGRVEQSEPIEEEYEID